MVHEPERLEFRLQSLEQFKDDWGVNEPAKVEDRVITLEEKLEKIDKDLYTDLYIHRSTKIYTPYTGHIMLSSNSEKAERQQIDDLQHENEQMSQRIDILAQITTKQEKQIQTLLNQTTTNAQKLMENELIFGGIPQVNQENTKQEVLKFLQVYLGICATDQQILFAYCKGPSIRKNIRGKVARIPRMVVAKCTPVFKQQVMRAKTKLKGKRDAIEWYGYYAIPHKPEVISDTKDRFKETLDEVNTYNKDKSFKDCKKVHVMGTNLYIDGELIMEEITPPDVQKLTSLPQHRQAELSAIQLWVSITREEKGNKFVASVAEATSLQQVNDAYIKITLRELHSVPHKSNSLISNYRLFRRPPSAPKITPLTQC